MDALKGYKTVGFFVLVLLVAVANLFGFGDFTLTEEQQDIFNVVVPLAGLVLRYLTETPIFKKEVG